MRSLKHLQPQVIFKFHQHNNIKASIGIQGKTKAFKTLDSYLFFVILVSFTNTLKIKVDGCVVQKNNPCSIFRSNLNIQNESALLIY